MRKAEEMRMIAENKIKEIEQADWEIAKKHIESEIEPKIQERANSGYMTVVVDKCVSSVIHAKVESLLRKNGYKTDYAEQNKIRISW